jgi:hypothetical protein
VRRAVTLGEGVNFEDFRVCPGCYSSQVTFSPTQLFEAIETEVIEPLRSVQEMIDRAPYTTRLYTTMSAAEMTVDPVFLFNPDLPELSNVHQAERVLECDRSVYSFEAPWRIDFPQGSTIRGTADSVGNWPDAVNEQPANLRVLSLTTSGEGAVLADNSEVINGLLATYNDGVPGGSESGVPGSTVTSYDSNDGCSLSKGQRPAPLPLPFVAGFTALISAGWLRRRANLRRAPAGRS